MKPKTSKQLEEEADRLLAEADAAQKQPYKVFSTKISAEQARKFEAINKVDGASEYEVIQMLIDAYIRLKDPGQVVSPALNKLRIAFEIGVRLVDRLRLSDPSAKVDVREATYFLGDKEHKGMRMVHVYQPFMGDAESTQNLIEILERTVEEMPVLHQKLKKEAKRRGIPSIYELLCTLADEMDGIEDVNEIEETFADVNKNDFGKEMADGPYKRTMVNSMSSFEQKMAAFERRQTSIDFGDGWTEEDQINETF